ncbi:hypothetical protein EHQ58_08815 [Leptospira ognonensis]|uniref:Tetratricopeptide repeat protein n=1 Tax=Leptospira ognonensis TaxID=2484945 RepID=A0A4R9K4Z3_9LEPT|nr:hypothetical protein [Leptospira ognonensis]TGL59337.1 hypothetical protein EHQ58_08815 [Leptospira ognonensis]
MTRNWLLTLIILLITFSVELTAQTKRGQGWSLSSGIYSLMIAGREMINSKDGFRFQSPSNLTPNQEIDYYLSLGELYLRRKDKVGVANILYDLRIKKGDYAFADAILTSLWKQAQGDDTQAVKILDTFIQKEPNTYFRNLAKNMRVNLYQEGEDEKKTMIRMDCVKSKPYYSLCRVFRLQYYIDVASGKEKELHKHYVNIMRVASPFFEDPLLEWIPLLDWIDQDLPAKMAFLGLIREANYFQAMIMDLERVSDGDVSENSIERYSFFQVLAGDYMGAEDSLIQYLNITKGKKSSFTNRIYVKLGVLAYLQKNYKKSNDYYLKLDIANWSTNVLHPILNEPLSITGAKDLVSVTIWKLLGADQAIRALQKIQDPDKLTEDDIWPKLRLAQILIDQNPELSSRITDEIIYMAQGKGWRRLEYAATVLQGYTQIYRKEFRRSTIELTKSRGILNPENAFYASEFIRNFGFVFAHTASGKRGPISGNIREGIHDFQNQVVYEDLFFIRNYRPMSFPTEQFFEHSIQFLKDESDHWGLLDVLFRQDSIRKTLNDKNRPHSLSQVKFIDQQLKYLSGFQSPRESKFFDSTYVDSRNSESQYLSKMEEESVVKSLEAAKHPTVVLLPQKDSIYIFFYNPKENKKNALTWKEVRTTRLESIEVTESIKDFYFLVKDSESIQFYMNEAGYIAHKNLKKDVKDKDISLFYFMYPALEVTKPQTIVTWDCPMTENIQTAKGFIPVDRSYFEGSRILKDKDRLHLWDFPNETRRDGNFMELTWSCKNKSGSYEEISTARLIRRIDYRTVPKTIVYSEKVLGKGLPDGFSFHTAWMHFWFKAGVRSIIYRPKWSYSDINAGNFLLDPAFYREEGVFISQTPQ